ncbi:hypothetical protein CTAYLR_000784 [Chrysophaeum taylorii]|uniref:HMG box domain-containing protein n=1 Tax=Chrysophaeum taylorii TaxID=2483200 RepID=A0AAD7UR26_9STRA|nr:hypothetical protein CTAYLR_000784 [Chrysophaeum taylorii]
MLFFCEHKDSAQAAHPNAAPHEISQIIAEQWKGLSPEKSRAYSVLSATYTEQKKAGAAANPKKRKERKEKDPKAPKSATSAYMYFSKHHRMLLKQENSDLTFGDLGKTVGAMWKAATPEEKRPFEELAAEDKNRYINELNDYRSLQADEPPPQPADDVQTSDDQPSSVTPNAATTAQPATATVTAAQPVVPPASSSSSSTSSSSGAPAEPPAPAPAPSPAPAPAPSLPGATSSS